MCIIRLLVGTNLLYFRTKLGAKLCSHFRKLSCFRAAMFSLVAMEIWHHDTQSRSIGKMGKSSGGIAKFLFSRMIVGRKNYELRHGISNVPFIIEDRPTELYS